MHFTCKIKWFWTDAAHSKYVPTKYVFFFLYAHFSPLSSQRAVEYKSTNACETAKVIFVRTSMSHH